ARQFSVCAHFVAKARSCNRKKDLVLERLVSSLYLLLRIMLEDEAHRQLLHKKGHVSKCLARQEPSLNKWIKRTVCTMCRWMQDITIHFSQRVFGMVTLLIVYIIELATESNNRQFYDHSSRVTNAEQKSSPTKFIFQEADGYLSTKICYNGNKEYSN